MITPGTFLLAWNDVQAGTNPLKNGASTAPTFAKILGNGASNGVFGSFYKEGDGQTELIQFPHNMLLAPSTVIKPHIHWAANIAIPAGQTVIWSLEYFWWDIDHVLPAATTLDSLTYISPAAGTPANTQILSNWADVPVIGHTLSSIFGFSWIRGNGTFADGTNIVVLAADIHIRLADGLGSQYTP